MTTEYVRLEDAQATNERNSIESLAVSALRQSPISALHSVEVTEEGEVIVLTGELDSYYCRQLAQEAVIAVTGGRQIHNNIRVLKPKHVQP